jgi:hypothetical protein
MALGGSGDESETDNKASDNPQPSPRPKILRLRLSVGQKKEWLRWTDPGSQERGVGAEDDGPRAADWMGNKRGTSSNPFRSGIVITCSKPAVKALDLRVEFQGAQ